MTGVKTVFEELERIGLAASKCAGSIEVEIVNMNIAMIVSVACFRL